jgi:hypothetical protein
MSHDSGDLPYSFLLTLLALAFMLIQIIAVFIDYSFLLVPTFLVRSRAPKGGNLIHSVTQGRTRERHQSLGVRAD